MEQEIVENVTTEDANSTLSAHQVDENHSGDVIGFEQLPPPVITVPVEDVNHQAESDRVKVRARFQEIADILGCAQKEMMLMQSEVAKDHLSVIDFILGFVLRKIS